MLNSIGIPSKGADEFLERVIPLYARYETPLVISISADTGDQFAELCHKMSVPGVAAIEVNISCPNLEADGKAFAMRQRVRDYGLCGLVWVHPNHKRRSAH